VTPLRWLRIGLFAVALVVLFNLSQEIGALRGNEPVPGLEWSFGVLALVFLFRAAVTEYGRGPEANLQKDVLWGLGAGGILAILSRW
jgi:hypothetical protein